MNKLLAWLLGVQKSLRKIKLVDRCLIVFMLVLLMQSTYTLFANKVNSQETSAIDIVVRTTSAAIFGYFLSANFIKKSGKKTDAVIDAKSNLPQTKAEITPAGAPAKAPLARNRIGFLPDNDSKAELGLGEITSKCEPASETAHLQVIIATIIGVFCLCVLILVRNFSQISPAMLATISQMRDFVSGCVGFLLGSPGEDD